MRIGMLVAVVVLGTLIVPRGLIVTGKRCAVLGLSHCADHNPQNPLSVCCCCCVAWLVNLSVDLGTAAAAALSLSLAANLVPTHSCLLLFSATFLSHYSVLCMFWAS